MAGQDWLEKDFYAVLGVPKDADDKAIKKAYRSLARKLHPDQNQGDPDAERRFKEVSEAYAVLSDDEQRKEYDALRTMAAGGARFSAGGGGGAGFEDLFGSFGGGGGSNIRFSTSDGSVPPEFEDILGGLFGGGGGGFQSRRGPRKGEDLHAQTRLPFRQAVNGSTVTLGVGGGQTMTVRIPPGVRDGQKIRIRGKGEPGYSGGPNGDLLVTVNVDSDPVFSLDGYDLRVTVPVTFAEAAMGGRIEVPTIDGGSVHVKVPAGTPSGRTLRVKGRGVKTKKRTGDLLVSISVAVPSKLSPEAKSAVEAFASATQGDDVRADLMAQAQRGAR